MGLKEMRPRQIKDELGDNMAKTETKMVTEHPQFLFHTVIYYQQLPQRLFPLESDIRVHTSISILVQRQSLIFL